MNRTQLWCSGGGTQSNCIAALIATEKLPKPDLAVIVDTEREQSSTWAYMDKWVLPALKNVGVFLHRVPKSAFATVDMWGGKDGDSLLIPAFTNKSGEIGKLPAYCSNEWKTRVIRRWATKTMGVQRADMWIGFTVDETKRFKKRGDGKWEDRYVLVELGMNKGDCIAYPQRVLGWEPSPGSSCYHCPNHTQAEWRAIKLRPADWKAAVAEDYRIREKDPNAYIHSECIPLDQVDLDDANETMFQRCDSGVCYV